MTMTTAPIDPTAIRADVTITLALAANPTATPLGMRECMCTLAGHCGALLAALAAAEQAHAETVAHLATARAALHSVRARAEADTLSPPALDGAGEASER